MSMRIKFILLWSQPMSERPVDISTEILSIFFSPTTVSISSSARTDAPTTKYEVDGGSFEGGNG